MAEHVPAEWHDKVLHAHFRVGEQSIMGADAPPGRYEQPKGFSVTINVDTPSEAERIFHSLAEGGTIQMLIQETFWALRFGMLVDRFGIPWMVNCAKEN